MSSHNTSQTASKPSRSFAGAGCLCAIFTNLLPSMGLLCLAWLVYGLQCDDSCGGDAGWTGVANSWQWAAQFWCLAVPCVVAAALFVGFLTKRHTGRAAWALLGSTLCCAAYFAFPSASGGGVIWPASDFAGVVAFIAVMVLGGLVSLAIERRADGYRMIQMSSTRSPSPRRPDEESICRLHERRTRR